MTRFQVGFKESLLLSEGVPSVPSPAPTELPAEEILSHMARAEGALRTHLWCPPGGPESSAEVIVTHGNLIRYLICSQLIISATKTHFLLA